MSTQHSKMTIVMGIVGVMALAVPAFAVEIIDDPMQIDERLSQVIQTSNSLCWEMNLYHQQQPNYAETYRAAKDLWTTAGQLRDALRAGPIETEILMQKTAEMNEIFAGVEKTLSKWGNGDRSSLAKNAGPVQRTVVTPGVGVDLPLLGVRVGGGREVIVTEDGPPQLERRRLHPNSRGSKRSLERELAAVKVAISYLQEDAKTPSPPNGTTPGVSTESTTVPQPPVPESTLPETGKIVPARKSDAPAPK